MRSREEIEHARKSTVIRGKSSEMERLLLEVLLDIRDLLQETNSDVDEIRFDVSQLPKLPTQ